MVDIWNMEVLMGFLGLGWNMLYEIIVIDNRNMGVNYND